MAMVLKELASGMLCVSAILCGPSVSAALADTRPNLLVIMTDDQSHDTLNSQFMPLTASLIADQGVTFTNGVDTTPLCCPSRTSFLTGKYARHTGVRQNSDLYTGPTFVSQLHDAGYYTGLVGKYLNSWPGNALPEFDYWADWIKDDHYYDPVMNLDGKFTTLPGYETAVLRGSALNFLAQAPADKPFFLLFTPHAPHEPAVPAAQYANLYADLPPWRPPTFNPLEQPGKPHWLQDTPLLTSTQIQVDVDLFRQQQLACLKSVDIAIASLLQLLQSQGRLDNTFIVFYSDNGYFWGEHRLLYKNRVYEEASRVPFAIRYPPLIPTSRVDSRIVANIDLAPTLLDLAGIPVPAAMDGRSLVPLLKGTAAWRDGILIEGWPDGGKEAFQAYRTAQYAYVETLADTPELYVLGADPFEMANQVNNKKYESVVRQLKTLLHNIRRPAAVAPSNVRHQQIDND